jgi:hypothetical protein
VAVIDISACVPVCQQLPPGCGSACDYIPYQNLYVTTSRGQNLTNDVYGLAKLTYSCFSRTWTGYGTYYQQNSPAMSFLQYELGCGDTPSQVKLTAAGAFTPGVLVPGCAPAGGAGAGQLSMINDCDIFQATGPIGGVNVDLLFGPPLVQYPYACFPIELLSLKATVALNGPLAAYNGIYPLTQLSTLVWSATVPGFNPAVTIAFGGFVLPWNTGDAPTPYDEPITYGVQIADAAGNCIAADVAGYRSMNCSTPIGVTFDWVNSHFSGPRGVLGKITVHQ